MKKEKVPKSLILTETSGKAKTLKKIVGSSYSVISTDGFLKDLPKSRIGIDTENNYTPDYITIRGKGSLLKELKTETLNARRVFLATDPDAAGEFIARQYCEIFGVNPKSRSRIVLNDLTKAAVKAGIENARPIDEKLADSFQAGQIIDKLASHRIGEYLECKIYRGVKVGRFRAILLKLIKQSAGGLKKSVTISGERPNLADVQKLALKELKFSASRTRQILTQLYEGFSFDKKEIGGLIKFPGAGNIELSDDLRKPEDVKEILLSNQFKLYDLIYKTVSDKHFSVTFDPVGGCDEAALLNALDELGIDWAAHYSAGIAGLIKRGYVSAKDSIFTVTELGERILNALDKDFDDVLGVETYKNISALEKEIVAGTVTKQELTENYCDKFEKVFAEVMKNLGDDAVPKEVPAIETDEVCEKCGNKMVIRRGRYGVFLACSGYPHCKNTKPYVEYLEQKCPKCGGRLTQRRIKGNNILYGCENFPTCDFNTWDEPQNIPCKICGSTMLLHRFKDRAPLFYCSNENCMTRENHPMNKILEDAKKRYEISKKRREERREKRELKKAAK